MLGGKGGGFGGGGSLLELLLEGLEVFLNHTVLFGEDLA